MSGSFIIAFRLDLNNIDVRHERGDDGHNLVTVVMNQLHISPQAAFNYISNLYDKAVIQFLEEWKNIPIFEGLLDLEVRTYCHGLAIWARANNSWNFEVRFNFQHFFTP